MVPELPYAHILHAPPSLLLEAHSCDHIVATTSCKHGSARRCGFADFQASGTPPSRPARRGIELNVRQLRRSLMPRFAKRTAFRSHHSRARRRSSRGGKQGCVGERPIEDWQARKCLRDSFAEGQRRLVAVDGGGVAEAHKVGVGVVDSPGRVSDYTAKGERRETRRMLHLAVDVGGTFTDICLFDDRESAMRVAKVSSTRDPGEGGRSRRLCHSRRREA
jgi:Hydantoinase/oxoprolinase N-terminal region